MRRRICAPPIEPVELRALDVTGACVQAASALAALRTPSALAVVAEFPCSSAMAYCVVASCALPLADTFPGFLRLFEAGVGVHERLRPWPCCVLHVSLKRGVQSPGCAPHAYFRTGGTNLARNRGPRYHTRASAPACHAESIKNSMPDVGHARYDNTRRCHGQLAVRCGAWGQVQGPLPQRCFAISPSKRRAVSKFACCSSPCSLLRLPTRNLPPSKRAENG